MNSLKKKLIMAATIALFAVNAFAGIDLQSMNIEEPLPAATAHQLLDKVLLHNPAVLDTVKAEVSDVQFRDRFNVVFAYVGRGNNGFSTEIYVVTVDKKGEFIDGAMLGIMGDVRCLVIDRAPGMQYKPSTTIAYDLVGDTVKVKRTYAFFTTELGGRYMHKDGEIFNTFILRANGTLMQQPAYTTAIMQEGHAPLPGKEELPTRTATTGEFDGYGMKVLQLMQLPVSAFDMDRVNGLVMWADKMSDQLTARDAKSTTAFNVNEVPYWATALCLRHADESLPWLAAHPDNDLMADCLVSEAQDDDDTQAWLTQCVKNLKDKKARKWWQKELKKNDM